MGEQTPPSGDQDRELLGPGLSRIRRRRWCLWSVIIIYLPLMGTAVELNWPLKAAAISFLGWFILLFASALYMALARCPRCGNYFHMHGLSYLPLRKCLHCQLQINADKKIQQGDRIGE